MKTSLQILMLFLVNRNHRSKAQGWIPMGTKPTIDRAKSFVQNSRFYMATKNEDLYLNAQGKESSREQMRQTQASP
jgi:hypothetical protein